MIKIDIRTSLLQSFVSNDVLSFHQIRQLSSNKLSYLLEISMDDDQIIDLADRWNDRLVHCKFNARNIQIITDENHFEHPTDGIIDQKNRHVMR